MKKVVIYANGLNHCSVCVSKEMKKSEIEFQVNLENPTGISSKWKISKEKTFKDVKYPNPCICNEDNTKMHYLMVC